MIKIIKRNEFSLRRTRNFTEKNKVSKATEMRKKKEKSREKMPRKKQYSVRYVLFYQKQSCF